jgi:RNA-directed DNA polymerase
MEPLLGNMTSTQGREEAGRPVDVSTKQQRIAQMAERYPGEALTSIHHFMDEEWLREAYSRLRKSSAPGVDGETVEQYGEVLEERLPDLLKRARSGSYHAPPVRRTYIPKGDGKEKRGIGIPTTEDKVLQRGVAMLLDPIYEQCFSESSYGFRAGRSQHQALEHLWNAAMKTKTRWILEVDIRKFFDTMDHGHLREVIRRRVRDGVVLRLIDKWLKAGVMEEGQLHYNEEGTPQGGVISPLLSNIFLDEVLDQWYEKEVKDRLKGRSFMVRFADDFVMGFENREDAERVMRVLPKRFSRYGLTIHPDKTKLVAFERPGRRGGGNGGETIRPGTFDFLGFTHYWGKSRKGNWVIKRKTASSRLSRNLKRIHTWCRQNRHLPIREQHRQLSSKLHGHYGYYGITPNMLMLKLYYLGVTRAWFKWLNRRTRRASKTWPAFNDMLKTYPLPSPRITHSVYLAKP